MTSVAAREVASFASGVLVAAQGRMVRFGLDLWKA